MDDGYVRLWRKIIDNPVWTTLEPSVLKVMLGFLLEANWKPAVWYDGHAKIQIPRGSFITSYSKMAAFCRLTVKQIRTAFKHLENLHFATYSRGIERAGHSAQVAAHSGAQRWTMVNVLNYDRYQASPHDEGTIKGTVAGRLHVAEGATTKEEIRSNEVNTCSLDGGLTSINKPRSNTLDQELAPASMKKKTLRNGNEPWERDEDFMAFFESKFWAFYPRRDKKKPAAKVLWKIYQQRGLDFLREKILGAVQEQRRPGGRLNPAGGAQYIPMATAWLNGEEWENQEPGESQPPSGRLMA
jgi:hypothetical protein